MAPLRWIFGLCFLFGVIFALGAWLFIPLPLGILWPKNRYTVRDSVISICCSMLAISGYFVWLGWGHYLFKARFPLLSSVNFSLLSLFTHVGCLIVLPFLRFQNILEVCLELPYLVTWIVLNIDLAGITLAYFRLDQSVAPK